MRYAYLKLAPFKLAFTVISGKPVATITLTSNSSYKTVLEVSESNDYMVPYEGPGSIGENVYQNDAFLIEVTCKENCSYSMLADSSDIPRRLAEGLPYKVLIDSHEPRCVQFISLWKNYSTHLLLSTSNMSNINYSVVCLSRSSWGTCKNDKQPLIIKTDSNLEMTNLELISLEGVYLVCMNLIDQTKPANVTVLHSANMNFRYIRPETYSLMVAMKDEPPIILKMNSHENQSTLVEVFECVGEVDFSASNDYKKFLANESVGLEHAKTAGHYAIKLPFSG